VIKLSVTITGNDYAGNVSVDIVTFNFSAEKQKVAIENTGNTILDLYIAGEAHEIRPGKKHEYVGYATTFNMRSKTGIGTYYVSAVDGLRDDTEAIKAEIENLKVDTANLQQKLNLNTFSNNLFDKTKATLNKSISIAAGGVIKDSDTYTVSDYITVTPGANYCISSKENRAFYDVNKTIVSAEAYSVGTLITVPANAVYMRVNVSISNLDWFKLLEGISMPGPYIPYSEKYWSQITTSPLKGKKIGFLGDSYTSEKTHLSYPTFIRDRTGCISYNYGESGSRVCSVGTFVVDGTSTDVDSFITRCSSMANDLDMVVVKGGINDSTTTEVGTINDPEAENSTFYAGYKKLLKLLVAKYPTAKIVCICPPQVPGYTALHTTFRQAIKDCAAIYGIPVLDLDATFSYSNVDTTLYTAGSRYISHNEGTVGAVGIHLNYEGRMKMSYPIQRFLESQFA